MKFVIRSIPSKSIIATIRSVGVATGLSFGDTKRLVDKRPHCEVVLEDKARAELLREDLEELGVSFEAKVEWKHYACTAGRLCDRTRHDMREWYHPESKPKGPQRDGYPGGDLVDHECPHCGLFFTLELPQ